MWVDTHAHFPSASNRVDEWVAGAQAVGVTAILAVGGSPELNRTAVQAARRHPATVVCALGLDRDQADRTSETSCFSEPAADMPRCVALGEIGLDYHYARATAPAQRRLFTAQLIEAARRALPVIVHSRAADADTLAAIDTAAVTVAPSGAGAGVLHCFTGDWAFAVQLLDRGFYISFSGILTFHNAEALRKIAARLPEERLLIETDAPFLSPAPYRGQPNEPARVAAVAQRLAALRGLAPERLAAITRANCTRLFGWPEAR